MSNVLLPSLVALSSILKMFCYLDLLAVRVGLPAGL